MGTKQIIGRDVIRPTTTPLASSVLDHATVKTYGDGEGFGMQNNAGLWPSYNCLDTLIPTVACPDVLGSADGDRKVFAFGGWQPAFEFVVYGAVQCQSIGLDRDDMNSEIRRVFEANVGKGIEAALLENRFVADPDAADHTPDWWGAPVDVSVTGLTGSLSVLAALAALEGYAATVYAGVPTIHMPRAAATILEAAGAIVWKDEQHAVTKNKSKVAIGGGYDDPTAFSAGDITMYASGEVYVERSGEVEINEIAMRDITYPDAEDTIPPGSNLALVEEMFRVAVDCFTAKATASLS